MTEQPDPAVTRRHVFYVPGFDPHPPRRYRELYRKEAKRQAEISGYRIAVRAAEGRRGVWKVAGDIEGRKTLSVVEVLGWSDIVQQSMNRSIASTYLQLLKVVWIYVASGALRRLMWLRKGPIVAAFYPVVMLLAQLLIAALLGKLAAALLTGGLGRLLDAAVGVFGFGPATAGTVWGVVDWTLGWAVFGAVVWAMLRYFRSVDHRLFAHYLMHDFAYTVQDRGAWPADLDARIDDFAGRLEQALAAGGEEVLIVGHSSGAALAVSAIARLLRNGKVPANGPALSLLTLGHAIPMISFLPAATVLRRDLHDLAASRDIAWVDVSAPGDGCCFALCDPVAVTGVSPEDRIWPLVISAAFSRTLSEETRAALRSRWFRLHFQYLCAFDRPGDYDYFRITAGPRTLGQRFAGRKPSVSRIDVPASRFRSMAA